ncbi:MAG: dienelactone hydrolase family protein [Acidimicrobiia bacterium]
MSGLAYFVGPEVPGPTVLLLHSWHGLNSASKRLADRLADEGFTVLAPDLLAGAQPATPAEAESTLAASDPNDLVAATLGGLGVLGRTDASPVRVVGMGMGGSLGLWLSVRRAAYVEAVASFYGTQSIDFDGSKARYQLHLADDDPWVNSDDAVFMEATIGLSDLTIESFTYPGARPGFFEEGEFFAPEAAELAWSRLLPFLRIETSDVRFQRPDQRSDI